MRRALLVFFAGVCLAQTPGPDAISAYYRLPGQLAGPYPYRWMTIDPPLRMYVDATGTPHLTIDLPATAAPATGIVRYFQLTNPAWDADLNSTDFAKQATIRTSVQRMGVFTSFFDSKLPWFPDALVYFDSYAIYTSEGIATAHPEWILRDAAGNKLYIPWGCDAVAGVCPQFAGDLSNPAFRDHQVAAIAGYIAANGEAGGYRGLWLDDVNLALAVSDGAGVLVAPVDSQTHAPMTAAAWRGYFAALTEAIRAAFPDKEILHNSVWSTMRDLPGDSAVKRQVMSADMLNVERGCSDPGLSGGAGPWTLAALMTYIDSIHALGRGVVLQDYALVDQTYSLACYFLIQTGADYFGVSEQTIATWPANLYRVYLGAAKAARYKAGALWRRDFAQGFVLLNEPGAAPVTLALPAGTFTPDGTAVPSVTLGPKQGAVLVSR